MALDSAERIERGRHLLVLGMLCLVGGTALGVAIVAWSGLAISLVAFASSSVGKVGHFRALPVPASERWWLLGTWVALAVLASATLATVVARAFAGVDGWYFWLLALAATAVALLHRHLQVRFLSGREGVEPGEY